MGRTKLGWIAALVSGLGLGAALGACASTAETQGSGGGDGGGGEDAGGGGDPDAGDTGDADASDGDAGDPDASDGDAGDPDAGDDADAGPGCNESSDPLGLADGTTVLFVDQHACKCHDPAPGEGIAYAMDPTTPLCNLAGIGDDMGAGGAPRLAAGNTVLVRAGDYDLSPSSFIQDQFGVRVTASGAAGQRITIASYPQEKATVRAGSDVMSASLQHMIGFVGTSYLTIAGIDFVGHVDGPGGRVYIPYLVAIFNAYDVEIQDSSFLDLRGNDDVAYGTRYPPELSYAEPWGSGLHLYGLEKLSISGSRVRCTDSPAKIAVDLMLTDGVIGDDSSDILVTNSLFEDCGHISLSLRNCHDVVVETSAFNNRFHSGLGIGNINQNPGFTDNVTISRNHFFGTNEFLSYSSFLGNAIQIGPGTISNVRVLNNVIHDGHWDATGVTLVANLVQDPNTGPISDTLIANNTMYHPGSRGIYLGQVASYGQNAIVGTQVFNNIVQGVSAFPGGQAALTRECVLFFSGFEANGGYGNYFQDNLLFGGDPSAVVVNSVDIAPMSNDLYTYTAVSFDQQPFADGTLGQDPLFVDAAGGDFHLAPGSPAGNAGTCLAAVPTDYEGTPRPAAGCDIGAFESAP